MTPHRFDPISAVLGLAAGTGGVVVALGAANVVDSHGSGAIIAGLAIVAGLLLIPWGRTNPVDAPVETASNGSSGEISRESSWP